MDTRKVLLSIMGVVVVLGAGWVIFTQTTNSPTYTSNQTARYSQSGRASTQVEALDTSALTTSYTLDEVANHATPADCWMAVDGVVYDISAFVSAGIHKGGMDIVTAECGTDATTVFSAEHRGPHAAPAFNQLYDYAIGLLQ